MAVDWETRVDYERLRAYRLGRAKEQLERNKLGAFLCFDNNNIRYITGVHAGEWTRDKMVRCVLLPRGGEPILFEAGTATAARKLYSPWMEGHLRVCNGWGRGGVPQAVEGTEGLARDIVGILHEHGVEKEPLAMDLI